MAELNGRRGGSRAWERIRKRIMARDGGRCVVCGGPGDSVDHIIPRAAGGQDDWHNLQTLCDFHHRRKTVSELRTLSQMPRKRRNASNDVAKQAKQAKKGEIRVFVGLDGAGSSPFGPK